MEAFFLSIIALLAFLVVVTALCTLLRFGMTHHPMSAYEGVGHLTQPGIICLEERWPYA